MPRNSFLKAVSILLTASLILETVPPSAAAFPTKPLIQNTQFQAAFQVQALASTMQMARHAFFGHRARGYQELERPVLAMQEANRYAPAFFDVVRKIAVEWERIRAEGMRPISSAPLEPDISPQGRLLDLMRELNSVIGLIPYGENDWLPELAEVVMAWLRESPIDLAEFERSGGLEELVARAVKECAGKFQTFRNRLAHNRALKTQKVGTAVYDGGELPKDLFRRPTRQEQKYLKGKFFDNVFLRGMLEAALEHNRYLRDPRDSSRDFLIAEMLGGARRNHYRNDRNALLFGEGVEGVFAMQPPPTDTPADKAPFKGFLNWNRIGHYEVQAPDGDYISYQNGPSKRAFRLTIRMTTKHGPRELAYAWNGKEFTFTWIATSATWLKRGFATREDPREYVYFYPDGPDVFLALKPEIFQAQASEKLSYRANLDAWFEGFPPDLPDTQFKPEGFKGRNFDNPGIAVGTASELKEYYPRHMERQRTQKKKRRPVPWEKDGLDWEARALLVLRGLANKNPAVADRAHDWIWERINESTEWTDDQKREIQSYLDSHRTSLSGIKDLGDLLQFFEGLRDSSGASINVDGTWVRKFAEELGLQRRRAEPKITGSHAWFPLGLLGFGSQGLFASHPHWALTLFALAAVGLVFQLLSKYQNSFLVNSRLILRAA